MKLDVVICHESFADLFLFHFSLHTFFFRPQFVLDNPLGPHRNGGEGKV